MKQFSCGDVVPGCGRVLCEVDDDAVLAAVAVHAKEDHGLLTLPDALVAQVRARILVAA